MADNRVKCPRCRTRLSSETRCPVCGLDLSRPGAGRAESFAELVMSALPGGTLGGYAIEDVVSSGARRAVVLARAAEGALEKTGQLVAMKLVAHDRTSPAVQEELIERARRAVGVRHESLAALVDVGADPGLGVAYFVSDFAPGEDLAKGLAEAGTMPPAEAAALGISIVRALEALHEAGAVHMDVKPAHVILDRDETGRARLVETGFPPVLLGGSGHGETAHEPVVGTPTYVAPEQARDAAAASPASDLYSLGAVLFHLLAGRPPFVGDSAVGILVQHASRPAPPVKSLAPAVPDELALLIDALLAKDPASRPSAGEVATILTALAGPPAPAPAPADEQKPEAPARPEAQPEPEALPAGRQASTSESGRARPAGIRPGDAGARGSRPLSRAWLAREGLLAAILIERGAVSREDMERALLPESYSPEARRGLAQILPDLGLVSAGDMAECENDLAARDKRRRDAAFGRQALEAGRATRADFDRILAETGSPWEAFSETLVRTGVLTREEADEIESSSLRYLRELDTAQHQRAARERGIAAEAVGAARGALGELPPEDDRSIFQIMMEQGSLTPVEAWALAAENVRRKLEAT